ncbi:MULTISPECIES: hypothetical protein [unclassified Variovorax]|uniref:hypothetical protein n=1 Tax=unclassified Variovorax TaxID=663243 RepID=UPI003F4482E9
MRTRLSPKLALRLGAGFAVSLFVLAAVLSLGFKAGAGLEWARHAMVALGVSALLAGVLVAWCVTRSIARSSRDAELVSQRLDRVFKNFKASDS